MKISNTNVGWPIQVATELMVRVMPFESNATICGLYYELKNESGEMIANGNLQLTEEEFSTWGQDNIFIENIALSRLSLTRLIEVIE